MKEEKKTSKRKRKEEKAEKKKKKKLKQEKQEKDDKTAHNDDVLTSKVDAYQKEEKKPKKKEKKEKKRKRKERLKNHKEHDRSSKEMDVEQQREEECQTILKGITAVTGSSNPFSSRIVSSSAIEYYDEQIKQQQLVKNDDEHKTPAQKNFAITLLLFYQYVEPVWDESTYNFMLTTLQKVGNDLQLTGRMRVAKEGLNCTLTGSHDSIVKYCKTLRELRPKEFSSTEFKLTRDLPQAQKFPSLKVFKVVELVHYGLEGAKAPPIAKFSGTHLEPKDYHQKLGESNTVIIDVRNHYEAAIGRFVPPSEGHGMKKGEEPPKWLDPKMRKSTEFPAWLDKPEVKEEMKGKQVLMYCTGMYKTSMYSSLFTIKNK